MSKFLANQKLWTVKADLDGYYYEIKCQGIIIDRVPLSPKAIHYFAEIGLLPKGVM